MLHVRLAQAFQPGGDNTIGEPQKPRLNIGREPGDLSGDGFVQDFDLPGHQQLYLNFEIIERATQSLAVR